MDGDNSELDSAFLLALKRQRLYFDQSNDSTLGKQMQTIALTSVINKVSIKLVFIAATLEKLYRKLRIPIF